MSLTDLGLLALSGVLARKEASAEDATRACLDRIGLLNRKLNAFVTVSAEGALEAARASDARRARGEARGPLDGVPVAVKDVFCTEGLLTTAGSRILENYVPPYDATVVARLREAGAVILGKLNQDEFAMGSASVYSYFGSCRNPWDLERTPGGSSGGSAAAVAARLCYAALGTDTGGSVRQPAALTGTVGLKPTYGRLSRYGVIAFASSLDAPGPFARSVADLAEVLTALAGHDPKDSTSVPATVEDWRGVLGAGVKGLRIGVPREYFQAGLDPETGAALRAALDWYQQSGAVVEEVFLPHTPYAIATYYVVAPAEASSNLARYDGVRYGRRAAEPENLADLYQRTRSEGFGPEVRRRIMLGTYALSAGYYDAYYLKAQKVRALIKRDFDQAFEKVDLLLTPTSPAPAWRLDEKQADPLSMYLADVYTVPASLAGLPGLALPCGVSAAGLPLGMQLLGRPFDEAVLLRAGAAYEGAHGWHLRAPEVTP